MSEGEKIAIAFVYFTIYLKNSTRKYYQIFILTHSFDFLKLLLNWFKGKSKTSCKYYMIKNPYDINHNRIAELDGLDLLLQKYATEYQYLFKLLWDFNSKADANETIESVYQIPNLVRKTLESFLMFMVPGSESVFRKLEKMDFDAIKKIPFTSFQTINRI